MVAADLAATAVAVALSAVNRFYSDIQRQLCQPTDELTMPPPSRQMEVTATAAGPTPRRAAVAAAEIRDLSLKKTTAPEKKAATTTETATPPRGERERGLGKILRQNAA